jgi:hypothetical protein
MSKSVSSPNPKAVPKTNVQKGTSNLATNGTGQKLHDLMDTSHQKVQKP